MRLLLVVLAICACRREPTQILVHVRTTAAPEMMGSVLLEVQRGGETKSTHVLERDPSDRGEIGSFGIIPEEGDLDSELVLVLTAIVDGLPVKSFVRRIDGFANKEKRQVFVCLADRCLGSESSCAAGRACSIDGCEPEDLPTFGAPLASWERCLVEEPEAPPDDLDAHDRTTGLDLFSAGGSGNQRIADIALDGDRHVLVAGNADTGLSIGGESFEVRSEDAFLLRAGPDGTIDWIVQVTGAGAQTLEALDLDRDGNVFVIGTFGGELRFERDGAEIGSWIGSAGRDVFVGRFSPDGALEAVAIIASEGDDHARGIAFVPETRAIAVSGALGGVIAEESAACGWAAAPTVRSSEAAFVAGFDATGLGCRFGVTFGSARPSDAIAVARTPRGIAIGGRFEESLAVISGEGRSLEIQAASGDSSSDAFLALLDSSGGVQRLIDVGGPGHDEVLDLIPSFDGELVLVGSFGPGDRKVGSRTATTAGGQTVALALNPELELLRSYATTFPPVELMSSRVAVVRSALVIAGGFRGSLALPDRPLLEASGDSMDAFMLRISRLGRPLTVLRFGAEGSDLVHGLATEEVEPRVIVAGEFGGSIELGGDTLVSTGDQDAFLYGVEVEP